MYGESHKAWDLELIIFVGVVGVCALLLLFALWKHYRESKQQEQTYPRRRRVSIDSSVIVFAPQQFKPV